MKCEDEYGLQSTECRVQSKAVASCCQVCPGSQARYLQASCPARCHDTEHPRVWSASDTPRTWVPQASTSSVALAPYYHRVLDHLARRRCYCRYRYCVYQEAKSTFISSPSLIPRSPDIEDGPSNRGSGTSNAIHEHQHSYLH